MYLTKEEERMLDGEEGEVAADALRILVKFGEIFRAERLVKIKHAHISCTTWTVEYALVDWLNDLVKRDAKVRVPASTMVTNIDLDLWKKLGISEEWYKKQMLLLDNHKKMGVKLELTCTPYFIPWVKLNFGDHVSWCESSAIIYGNSVMGIRTNRECCQSALFAAITGRTPEFGFHLKENRRGQVLVEVKAKMENTYDFSILGYHLAPILGLKTPVINGIKRVTVLDYTVLSAAFSTKAGISMFHMVEHTPEAKTLDDAFQGDKPEDKIVFTQEDLEEGYKNFRYGDEKIDYVYIGCPHLNYEQIKEVAELLKGKKIASGVTLWVGTSRSLKKRAEEEGYSRIIKEAGGHLISDTCGVIIRHALGDPPGTYAFNCMKQVYYLRGNKGYIGSIKECVNAAITGRWRVSK